MASAYEVNRRLALDAESRGDALAATVRWCMAAHGTEDELERIGALASAVRDADLALHQAVHASQRREHYDEEADEWHTVPRRDRARPSWRELAAVTGIPPSTLNRRYRGKPLRMPPRPVELGRRDVEQLMEPDAALGRGAQEPGLS